MDIAPAWRTAQGFDSADMRHGFFPKTAWKEDPFFISRAHFPRTAKQCEAEHQSVMNRFAPGKSLCLLRQIHGHRIVEASPATKGWTESLEEADGHWTRDPSLVLGIMTADCLPWLLIAPDRGIVAALHAGWRGLAGNILERMVEILVKQGAQASTILGCIGPCIHAASYEVDLAFRDRFTALNADYAKYFQPSVRPGHAMADLPGIARHQWQALGLGSLSLLNEDTYVHPDRWYSYRRLTHQGGGPCPSILSVIGVGF
jgi:YfiH family protein